MKTNEVSILTLSKFLKTKLKKSGVDKGAFLGSAVHLTQRIKECDEKQPYPHEFKQIAWGKCEKEYQFLDKMLARVILKTIIQLDKTELCDFAKWAIFQKDFQLDAVNLSPIKVQEQTKAFSVAMQYILEAQGAPIRQRTGCYEGLDEFDYSKFRQEHDLMEVQYLTMNTYSTLVEAQRMQEVVLYNQEAESQTK